jgi:hypothetical protein
MKYRKNETGIKEKLEWAALHPCNKEKLGEEGGPC